MEQGVKPAHEILDLITCAKLFKKYTEQKKKLYAYFTQ